MAQSAPSMVFDSASIASFATETVKEMLSILEKHDVKQIDTASLYRIAPRKARRPKKFIIQKKAPGNIPGAMGKQNILDGMKKSLEDLGTDSVDIYYLHAPDPTTPIEDTLAAIQELTICGRKFGLSNFRAPDVQKIYDIQSAARFFLPSVFQGKYNAVSRHIEKDLFPLRNKLKISFYAYSPIAGGFLAKNSAQLRFKDDPGRFGPNARIGDMYTSMYSAKESLLQALDEWGHNASDADICKAALSYRWITFHSALKGANGDAVIVGASKSAQLEETLSAVEQGPLPESIAQRENAIWEKVEHKAPLDNYNSFVALKK